ncbi:MAG TPA: RHS repeat protein, partial [Rudaea sp.]|nr:RHS repeat protein [Rudaea sp.]
METEVYDGSGKLLSITDKNGFVTTLTYSTSNTPSSIAPTSGYLITVTDPAQRQLQFTYNANGMLATVTDPAGQVYRYTIDTNFNLASVLYPGTPTARNYLYNESAHTQGGAFPAALTGVVDENGARYGTFDYDTSGNAIATQHAGGVDKFSLVYNSDGSSDVTDPQNSVTHHAFTIVNGVSLASTLSGPAIGFANVATRTYDSYNNPSSTTDFNGVSTCYTYDQSHGLETSRVEGVTGGCSGTPVGLRTLQTDWDTALREPIERRIYNASGTLETKTHWVYNTRRQTTYRCIVDPAVSGALSYTCGSSSNAPTGVRQWAFTYCEQADVTAGTCPLVGLLKSTDGPRTDVSDVTTYAYYQTTDLSGCATLGGTCHYLGDLKSITNALGQVTTYVSYDKDGRVTRVQDVNGVYTDMTYHARG